MDSGVHWLLKKTDTTHLQVVKLTLVTYLKPKLDDFIYYGPLLKRAAKPSYATLLACNAPPVQDLFPSFDLLNLPASRVGTPWRKLLRV